MKPNEKVAIVIVNYNMGWRADDLAANVLARVEVPYELIVVDNGSTMEPYPKSTTIALRENVQMANGMRMGIHYADALSYWKKYEIFAYWLMITSARFLEDQLYDPLAPLVEIMEQDPNCVMASPCLTKETDTAWTQMRSRGLSGKRKVWGIDYIMGLYRGDWFRSIGYIDPVFRMGWGAPLEMCWMARRDGKTIYVHEDVIVAKDTNIGYEMNRMGMTAKERAQISSEESQRILRERYGDKPLEKLGHEFRTKDME